MSLKDRLYRSPERTKQLETLQARAQHRSVRSYRAYFCQATADARPNTLKRYATADGSEVAATHVVMNSGISRPPVPGAIRVGTLLDPNPLPEQPKAATVQDLQMVAESQGALARELAAQARRSDQRVAQATREMTREMTREVARVAQSAAKTSTPRSATIAVEGRSYKITWQGMPQSLAVYLTNLGFKPSEWLIRRMGRVVGDNAVPIENTTYSLLRKPARVMTPNGGSGQAVGMPTPSEVFGTTKSTGSGKYLHVNGKWMNATQITTTIKALVEDIRFETPDITFETWPVNTLTDALKTRALRAGFNPNDEVYTYTEGGCECMLGRAKEVNFAMFQRHNDSACRL